MAHRTLLSVSVFLALIALSTASCLPTCRFNLCPSTPLDLTPSDTPLSSPICLLNQPIGIVNTADNFISPPRATTFSTISEFSPPGLTQSFAPTFFKAFPRTDNTSAIGHQVPQGNQVEFLKPGTCVVVRVRAYQVVKSVRGQRVVVDNVHINRNRPFKDCVSFVIGGIARPSVPPPVTTGPPPTDPITPSTTTSTTAPSTTTVATSTTTAATSTTTTAASTATTAPITTTPTIVDTTTTTTSTVPPIPDFVQPNDTVTFPPTINIGDKVTFSFNVTVSAASGSSKEDFYLLSDATSSMSVAINEAKDRFSDIVDARKAASSDVAFGVGYYRDEREDDTFTNVQSITTDTTLAQDGIDTLIAQSASANTDGPEGNLVALYNIATKPNAIGWRPDSRRILVYFGDAPGHEPSCDGSLELTRAKVIDALNMEKITVVASSFSGGFFSPGLNAATEQFSCPAGTDDAAEGQATAITEQTGGKVVEAEEQEELIETILQTVGDLGQELEADTSDCDSQDIDVSFEPSLPKMLAAGETVTIAETVMVNRSVCESGTGAFTCTVKFTLSGVPIGEQTLTSAGLAGC